MKSVFSVCLFFLLSTAIPAAAHKVVISIYAGSGEIEGEIGHANGHMAPGVRVTVTDATGNPLGETRTDAEGRFTFVPAQAVEHVFRADPGAGHVAETRMSAHEIPLPDAPTPTTGGADRPERERATIAIDTDRLRALIRAEITPLRRELAARGRKNDLTAILGGIGYVLGVFGLGFYLAARRGLKGR